MIVYRGELPRKFGFYFLFALQVKFPDLHRHCPRCVQVLSAINAFSLSLLLTSPFPRRERSYFIARRPAEFLLHGRAITLETAPSVIHGLPLYFPRETLE